MKKSALERNGVAASPPLWLRALSFAARGHRGQLRKDGKTPYFAHPARVALIARSVFGMRSEEALTAAALHDVLEDGVCDRETLADVFGERVAGWVAELSKDPALPEAERERRYTAQLRRASRTARILKLADLYDNLCDAWDTPRRKQTLARMRRYRRAIAHDPSVRPALERFDARVAALRGAT